MLRRMTLSIGLLAGCAWCFLMVSRVDSAQPAPAAAASRPFKPVASIHGLMNGQALLFKSVRKAITNKETPQRLEHIEVYAEALAELANVNTYHSEKEDYQAWAGQMRDTALELAEEAEKSDADDARMNKLVASLKNTCGACHDAYQ